MNDNNKPVIVYGAGGHGKVVADVVLSMKREVVGFVDDGLSIGTEVMGFKVLGNAQWLQGQADTYVLALGIGDNLQRKHAYEVAQSLGFTLPYWVHRSAVVATSALIGDGTVVMAMGVVNAEAQVGKGVIVNSAAVVEHECFVDDFSHLSPHSAMGGRSSVGPQVHLGMGSVVLPMVSVGSGTIVGAGSVVNRPLESDVVAFGVPARTQRRTVIKKQ